MLTMLKREDISRL